MSFDMNTSPTYYEPWPIYCTRFLQKARRMAVSDWVEKCLGFIGYMDGNAFKPLGTAFLVAYEDEGRGFLYLVTAQHVITEIHQYSDKAALRMNTEDGVLLGPIALDQFYFHPNATEYIDVAVTPISIHSPQEPVFVNLTACAATKERMKELSIGPGDEIFVAGQFRYHTGESRNLPIVRTGNIAGLPDEPIRGKGWSIEGHLIEVRSLGGLSGSPVFVNMSPIRMFDNKAEYHKGLRHYLLGLIHGHYDEKDQNLITSAARLEGVNIGIAVVTPVERILETMECDELREKRKEILDRLKEKKNILTEDVSEHESHEKEGDQILETMLNTLPTKQKKVKKD